MQVNSVSLQQNNQSFGRVLLGRGGAKRLVNTMSPMDARILISRDFLGISDVLISENAVEVFSPEKDRIFKVSNVIASSRDYTDIEVFEHGKRNIFKVRAALAPNTYGANNQDINMALAVAKEMNSNPRWQENLRFGENDGDLPEAKQKAVEALEKYYKDYGMF